jgi:hypothetical protein
MIEPFDRKIRRVRVRCSMNLLIRLIVRILTVAGLIAISAILVERLLAFSIINFNTVLGFFSLAAALSLLFWLLCQPSRLQVSLLMDKRLKLHERFSTTLALSKSEDSFAFAAREEAYKTARKIDLKGHFPIRPPKYWFLTAGTWVVAAVLVLYMPHKDLLGFMRNKQQQQQQTQKLQQARVEIKEATNPVKLSIQQLDDPALNDALKELEQSPKDAQSQEVKRDAIRKLSDLSEKIKNMQNSVQMDSVKMLKQMFKQLRGSPDLLSQKLRLALSKGDFAQTSNLLSQLQKELAEGKLNEQQQKKISEQLQQLGEQLKELAQKNDEMEKELEKLGLDKELARMSQEELRKALEQRGLDPEKIEELMKKAEASQMALSQCAGLGGALAACTGGAGGSLSGQLSYVTDQLDEFDSLNQQLLLAQYSLDEIDEAIGCLGQGMGDGLFSGQYNTIGQGGGHGDGIGTMPGSDYIYEELENSETKKTRSQSKVKEGPIIASWYFQGSQIKGEAKRDFTEVLQAARDEAAEAVSENEIPRKYEEPIKKYFGGLEQSGTE